MKSYGWSNTIAIATWAGMPRTFMPDIVLAVTIAVIHGLKPATESRTD